MSRNTITHAQWGMQAELSELWKICFEEEPRPTAYFFNNMFRPQDCLLYKANGRVAAMVHMLPAKIIEMGQPVQAHYIYGACTHPDYRSHGYMRTLLKCAHYVGGRRGDHYSFLLPANRTLYNYYGKLGYLPNFYVRFLTLTREELYKIAKGNRPARFQLSPAQINSLRSTQLSVQNGSALWDNRTIFFAQGVNRQYGGVFVSAAVGKETAYAFCRRPEQGCCEVTEVMAAPCAVGALAANLLAMAPAQTYRFRLPDNDRLFSGRGTVSHFGMIKPIAGISAENMVQSSFHPYLGIAMD